MSMGDMKMEMPAMQPMAPMAPMQSSGSATFSAQSSSSSATNGGVAVSTQSNGANTVVVINCADPKSVSLIVNGRPAKIKFKDN